MTKNKDDRKKLEGQRLSYRNHQKVKIGDRSLIGKKR